jgi:putative methionine-R-sulfoxide reductase with GAF domain
MEKGGRPADMGPEGSIFGRDRRRVRRHRVHTPAYASLSGSAPGATLDLSEILDISESGMCIQCASPMKVNRLLPLCLDLSETGARIHVVGHVVWSDPSGKTGIRFPEMSEASRTQLREWLEANAKVEAAANLAMPSSADHVSDPEHAPHQTPKPTASPGYTSLVNEWAEIERDIDTCGPDLEPALHLVAQRALTLTWASGTAIALINRAKPSEMICRARAGTDSPEIGARLEAGSGFSGECVRSGHTITCDDTEYDTRVDRKSCRALGVRSIVATPVKRGNEIIGILEIFSPEPAAFWENDVTILQRLTKFIARAVQRAEHARADVLSFSEADESQFNLLGQQDVGTPLEYFAQSPASLGRRIALLLTGIACVTAVVWILAPGISDLGTVTSNFNVTSSAQADSYPDAYATWKLPELMKRANNGDARAEYALGRRYYNGEEVKQDYRQAMHWFLKAADQGNVSAQSVVALSFWAARGVPKDYGRAYFWALLAQAGGDKSGSAIVQQTAAYLSPAQIHAEQAEAEKWLHSHHIGHASE